MHCFIVLVLYGKRVVLLPIPHTLIQTDELWNPIIADGEDQESAVSFTAPQFARLQALCEYLQRPLRNLQAPQDPAPAGDAQ